MLRLFFIVIFFAYSHAMAHQPKLIYNSPSKINPYIVEFPEISKAFYSILTGKPHYYKIETDTQFLFYTGILAPKVSDTYQWLSLDVIDKNNTVLRPCILWNDTRSVSQCIEIEKRYPLIMSFFMLSESQRSWIAFNISASIPA